MALLINAGRTIPKDILKAWADRVKQEPDYEKVNQTQAAGRLVDENGLLLIDWPRLVDSGEPLQLDLLVVTTNDPEISAAAPIIRPRIRLPEPGTPLGASMPNIFGKTPTMECAPLRTIRSALMRQGE